MPSKDTDSENSSLELPERETQFVPREDDAETLWEVVKITAEHGNLYKVKWAGIDPSTKKPWPQSWVSKHDCTDNLVLQWKQERRRGSGRKRKVLKRASMDSKRTREIHMSPSTTITKPSSISDRSSLPVRNAKRLYRTLIEDVPEVPDEVHPRKRRKITKVNVSESDYNTVPEMADMVLKSGANNTNGIATAHRDVKDMPMCHPQSPTDCDLLPPLQDFSVLGDLVNETAGEHVGTGPLSHNVTQALRWKAAAKGTANNRHAKNSAIQNSVGTPSRHESPSIANQLQSSDLEDEKFPPVSDLMFPMYFRRSPSTELRNDGEKTTSSLSVTPHLSPASLKRLEIFDHDMRELEVDGNCPFVGANVKGSSNQRRKSIDEEVASKPQRRMPNTTREVVPETDAESVINTHSQLDSQGQQFRVSPLQVPSTQQVSTSTRVTLDSSVAAVATPSKPLISQQSAGSIVSKMKPRLFDFARRQALTYESEVEDLYVLPDISQREDDWEEGISLQKEQQTGEERSKVNSIVFNPIPQLSPSNFSALLPVTNELHSDENEKMIEEPISSIEQFSSSEGGSPEKLGRKTKGNDSPMDNASTTGSCVQDHVLMDDLPSSEDQISHRKVLSRKGRRKKAEADYRARVAVKVALTDLAVVASRKKAKGMQQEKLLKVVEVGTRVQEGPERLNNGEVDQTRTLIEVDAVQADVEKMNCEIESDDRRNLRQEEEESSQDLLIDRNMGQGLCSKETEVVLEKSHDLEPATVAQEMGSSVCTNPNFSPTAGEPESTEDAGSILKCGTSVREQERATAFSSINSLTEEKANLVKDVEFFREQYLKASAFVSSVRAENHELEERACIAERQAKTGVQLVKDMFRERIRLLEEDKKSLTRLAHFIVTKDELTNDEVRRRAAEEPQLRLRVEQLEKENSQLRNQNFSLRETLKNQTAELEKEASKDVRLLESGMDHISSKSMKESRHFSPEAEEADDNVFRCQWRSELGDTKCSELFRTVQELQAHMYSSGHLDKNLYGS